MDDKKILIIAVVLLVGIFILDKTGVTGKTVVDRPETISKIYVSDDETILNKENLQVTENAMIYFTSETGSKGTDSTLNIYKEIRDGRFVREETMNIEGECGDQVCRPGKIGKRELRVPTFWEGKYCAGLQDLETRKDILVCFTVI